MKGVFKREDLQIFGPKSRTSRSNFHPLQVVGRGSETQFQVGEIRSLVKG